MDVTGYVEVERFSGLLFVKIFGYHRTRFAEVARFSERSSSTPVPLIAGVHTIESLHKKLATGR
jgi:hypothetical protein